MRTAMWVAGAELAEVVSATPEQALVLKERSGSWP